MAARRLLLLLVVLAALAVPPAALRAACAVNSCAAAQPVPRVPFCPLPAWMKADIAAGYRDGRSPDVLGVPERSGLSAAAGRPAWPSVADGPGVTDVPLAFWGAGVDPSSPVPPGTTLDDVAPTIAQAIDLRRPHPDVRAGAAIPGAATGARPTLVVEIALEGVGSRDVRADPAGWPFLRRIVRTGSGSMDAGTGSLPLDPTAVLTTIGTGGLPDQHGMTGALIRDDSGHVVRAWGPDSPPSVISTLADDLEVATHGASLTGLVAPSIGDRGLIGGTWYPGHPTDELDILPTARTDPLPSVRGILAHGYGTDRVPDILGVALNTPSPRVDAQLAGIVRAAERAATGRAMIVVAGTGTTSGSTGGVGDVVRQLDAAVSGTRPVIAGTVPGGMFLDQDVMAARRISGQTVVDALLAATAPDGRPLFRDAFQGFAVSFARYC